MILAVKYCLYLLFLYLFPVFLLFIWSILFLFGFSNLDKLKNVAYQKACRNLLGLVCLLGVVLLISAYRENVPLSVQKNIQTAKIERKSYKKQRKQEEKLQQQQAKQVAKEQQAKEIKEKELAERSITDQLSNDLHDLQFQKSDNETIWHERRTGDYTKEWFAGKKALAEGLQSKKRFSDERNKDYYLRKFQEYEDYFYP